MANSAMFFENFRNQILLSINTCMPCKVLSYDEKTRMASIQPMFKQKEVGKEPQALSIIEDVPVLWQRMKVHKKDFFEVNIPEGEHVHDDGGHGQYTGSGVHSHDGGKHEHKKMKVTEDFIELHPVLESGDIVLAVFAQRSIDEAMEGNLVYPGSSRYLSVHDAIIVGIF
ncbi:Gp138 family membrane-puncturing spike protein [Solibacillus silvestris]